MPTKADIAGGGAPRTPAGQIKDSRAFFSDGKRVGFFRVGIFFVGGWEWGRGSNLLIGLVSSLTDCFFFCGFICDFFAFSEVKKKKKKDCPIFVWAMLLVWFFLCSAVRNKILFACKELGKCPPPPHPLLSQLSAFISMENHENKTVFPLSVPSYILTLIFWYWCEIDIGCRVGGGGFIQTRFEALAEERTTNAVGPLNSRAAQFVARRFRILG